MRLWSRFAWLQEGQCKSNAVFNMMTTLLTMVSQSSHDLFHIACIARNSCHPANVGSRPIVAISPVTNCVRSVDLQVTFSMLRSVTVVGVRLVCTNRLFSHPLSFHVPVRPLNARGPRMRLKYHMQFMSLPRPDQPDIKGENPVEVVKGTAARSVGAGFLLIHPAPEEALPRPRTEITNDLPRAVELSYLQAVIDQTGQSHDPHEFGHRPSILKYGDEYGNPDFHRFRERKGESI